MDFFRSPTSISSSSFSFGSESPDLGDRPPAPEWEEIIPSRMQVAAGLLPGRRPFLAERGLYIPTQEAGREDRRSAVNRTKYSPIAHVQGCVLERAVVPVTFSTYEEFQERLCTAIPS